MITYDNSLAELKPYLHVVVVWLSVRLDRESEAICPLSIVIVIVKVRLTSSYMLMIVAVSVARPAFVDMRNWMYLVARSAQMLMIVGMSVAVSVARPGIVVVRPVVAWRNWMYLVALISVLVLVLVPAHIVISVVVRFHRRVLSMVAQKSEMVDHFAHCKNLVVVGRYGLRR